MWSQDICSFVALNQSVICSSLGIHNIVEKGPGWLEISLGNSKATTLAGVRG
jgi:hypothetical protein